MDCGTSRGLAYIQQVKSPCGGRLLGNSPVSSFWPFISKVAFKGPLEQVDTWPVVKELTIVSLSVSASSLILLLFQLVDSFTVFQILLSNGLLEEISHGNERGL